MSKFNAGEIDSNGVYIPHQKIYPREVRGTFQNLRVICVYALLGLYYSVLWLEWDGRQAVLFDLPTRKFYIFDLILWPQDFFYLAWLLIIAGLTLFFVTAVAGRVWCGYACPQTVWTEVFIWMERLTEGNRAQRQKLDQGPWNTNKILRKSLKQFLWISFALWTGFTFVGYFTPVEKLLAEIGAWSLGPWEAFWMIFYSFATYGNAGFMREQVCKYMCPYARFQSAMFDKDSLIISYDAKRGEPRGKRKRGIQSRQTGMGDCIDCTVCVQVCPTGIDIRNGLQYECIACGACVDACDDIMEKMEYPKGLIRYTTENALNRKSGNIMRPRIFLYGIFLLLLIGGFFHSIMHRVPLSVDLIRDRNTLYRISEEGYVENIYTLKIANMDKRDHAFRISFAGVPNAQLSVADAPVLIEVAAGEIKSMALPVKARTADLANGIYDLSVILQTDDTADLSIQAKTHFISRLQ